MGRGWFRSSSKALITQKDSQKSKPKKSIWKRIGMFFDKVAAVAHIDDDKLDIVIGTKLGVITFQSGYPVQPNRRNENDGTCNREGCQCRASKAYNKITADGEARQHNGDVNNIESSQFFYNTQLVVDGDGSMFHSTMTVGQTISSNSRSSA